MTNGGGEGRHGARAVRLTSAPTSYTLCESRCGGISIDMTRSLKKGPYVDVKLAKKDATRKPGGECIKTWARVSQIAPDFVGFTFLVHTGKNFDEVLVTEDMVGHRLGEFAPTTKFVRHGGKMQKEIEQQKKAAEIATAQAAKSAAPAKK
jgi:small subunit ribosomal protein S19